MSHPAASLSARCAAIGSWRLHPGHAMSLRPKKTAVLRIFCGQVWVTLGGPYQGAPNDLGDRFLGPGDVLAVPAGARMVMEPIAAPGDSGPVHFDWSDASVSAAPSRFAREVVSPTRELGAALGQAGWALSRVLRGLLGYSEFLVAGRGRVLSPLESLRS
ncbi:DUF2917 domain-containing protein [Hydrogenophaga sp.]|uniref:DUF2917 domain-containing protein n=1 Tax=Hydrogenophaga sp. TaxID=1904254 RepID=UPI002736D4C5|nr:DUF2917 domain-containing protein [Hydrogenophaga sp.]MDP3887944.1 DUF2917 domain-containing protein [Hydrogenophaga sp.]